MWTAFITLVWCALRGKPFFEYVLNHESIYWAYECRLLWQPICFSPSTSKTGKRGREYAHIIALLYQADVTCDLMRVMRAGWSSFLSLGNGTDLISPQEGGMILFCSVYDRWAGERAGNKSSKLENNSIGKANTQRDVIQNMSGIRKANRGSAVRSGWKIWGKKRGRHIIKENHKP